MRIMEQNNKKIATNTFILAIQQVLSLVVALYTSRVILQSLGVEDFGIYNVVAGFVAMFAFLNTSMNNATQRFYNYEYGRNGISGAKTVYNCALIIQFILAFIVLLLLETLGLWYINNRLVVPVERLETSFWVFQFSSFSLMFVIMQIPYSAAITAHEKILCFATVSIIDSILKLLIAVAVQYIHGDRLLAYGFFLLLISFSDFAIFAFYAKRNFEEIVIEKKQDWSMLRQMLSFSGWNFFGSFAGVAKEQGVNLILNSFFGPVVNAARGIAYQVAGALKSFVSTVMISGRPQLTQSYAQNNFTRTISLMYSLSKASCLILLLFSIPVIFEIDYILDLWLSTNIPGYTGIFVNLVIVMSIIEALSPPVSFVVHASGRMAKYQIVTSVIMVMIIPISYLVLTLGADAVVVFWLGILFQVGCQISSLIILRGIIDYSIRDYFRKVICTIGVVVVTTVVVVSPIKSIIEMGFFRLVVTTIVSSISILISTYIFVLDKEERNLAKQVVFKLLKNNE